MNLNFTETYDFEIPFKKKKNNFKITLKSKILNFIKYDIKIFITLTLIFSLVNRSLTISVFCFLTAENNGVSKDNDQNFINNKKCF